MTETPVHSDACAEALRKAEESVYSASNALWSPQSRPVKGTVLNQAAVLNDALERVTKEFCGHLPGASTREHADALDWVAQRHQQAAAGLRAIAASLAAQELPEPSTGPLKLSTGATLTPDPAKVVLTLEMLHELARSRFGSDPKRWRFTCPACLSETAVGDFAEIAPNGAPGQECIGRYLGESECNHAAYGILSLAPWIIITPEGKHVLHFALADADPVPESEPDLDSNAGQEVPHEGKTASDVAGS